MSQVTPRAGQTWIRNIDTQRICVTSIQVNISGRININCYDQANLRNCYSPRIEDFQNQYTFQPANDLEWLAVEHQHWDESYRWVRKSGDDESQFTNRRIRPRVCYYNHEQWQQCRYDLGLDTKENEMLKLTQADVGKEFDADNGDICRIIIVGDHDAVVQRRLKHYTVELSGNFKHGIYSHLTGRHEDREWLKDMPDAEIFDPSVKRLYCNGANNWYAVVQKKYSSDIEYTLEMLDMPKLTGPETVASSITLAELREYQEQNK